MILSVKTLNSFEEINVVTVTEPEFVCQTISVFFFFFFFFFSKNVFFLTRSLTDRCQIVTDTLKKMLVSFFESLLSQLSLNK